MARSRSPLVLMIAVALGLGADARAAGAQAAGDLAPPPPVAFTGATLVDGTGAAPVQDAVVVIREGRIACAGPRAACPVDGDDVEVVDVRGKWIIPGLVDAHVHYSQTGFADGRPDAQDLRERFPYDSVIADLRANPERFYRSYLCSGVTATFDVGGYPWTWDLRDDAERSTRAPHVAAAGPLLSTRDHWLNLPAERQFIYIADEESTRAGARYLAAHGTDAFKVWFLIGLDSDTTLARTLIRVAGEEAERASKPLIVHATGLWQAKLALEAGAKLLVHSVEDADVDDGFIQLARRAETVYTPTLVVYQGYEQLRAHRFDASRYELACVDPATRAKAFLTDSLPGRPEEAQIARMQEVGRERYRRMLRNVKRMHDAGIPIAMGTDAGNPLTLHGPSVYLEMEALQEAGLTPLEVLTAATRNGALAMGRLDDFGTLEPGKIADLVLLDADPTADIRNARRVALVVRGGKVWTRQELEYDVAAGTPADR